MNVFADVAGWWLSAQLLGVLALPLTVWFFRRLPERGYSFARPFGLLLTGYGAWLLSMLGLGAFGRGLLLLVGVALAAGGVALLGRSGLRRAVDDLRARLPWLVLVELLFALGLFAGVWMRWHDIFAQGVDLTHTEQPMDLTLLSGILASSQFPPQDPWFAQYPINYYYLGYLLVAALIRLSGVSVGSGFTLGIATIWAFAATGTAGLIYNMIGLAGERENQEPRTKNQVEQRTENREQRTENREQRTENREQSNPSGTSDEPQNLKPETWNLKLDDRNAKLETRNSKLAAYLVPLLGVVLVLLVGNQAATLQVLAGSEKVVAYSAGEAAAAVLNGLGARAALPLPAGLPGDLTGGATQLVPWPGEPNRVGVAWWSSRAVWDTIPQANGESMRAYAITEFPLFSFLLGDLHPHVLSLPWSLLALAVALNVLARRSAPELRARGGWVEVVLTGIVLGGLYAINSWDLPTYLLVYLGALTLLYLRLAPSPRAFFWPHFLQQAAAVILASYLLYLPFYMSFDAPTADPPIGFAATRTSLWHFLVMFGLFVVPLTAFVLREYREVRNQGTKEPRNQEPRSKNREQTDEVGSWRSDEPQNTKHETRNSKLEAGNSKLETRNSKLILSVRNVALGLALILIAGVLLGWPLFVLLPLALLAAWGAHRRSEQPGIAFGLWMFAVGALVVWGCDVVYLRDDYGSPRMNTIFKLYYQVWLIWGAAAAFALWRLFKRLRPASLLWLAPTAALLVSASTYLLVAPNRPAPSNEIDGLAYLSRAAPDEAAAVEWVRRNTPVDAVIAMAPGRAYDPNSSRIASATGRPTIVGWTQHENLWRGSQAELSAQVAEREQDVTALYSTADPDAARQMLGKYGANYLYLGPNERNLAAQAGAPPEALAKFDQFMSRVFEQGEVVLYQVR